MLISELPNPIISVSVASRIKSKKLLMALIMAILFSPILYAQTWDAGGDGESWNDPLNWDNDLIPGPTDDVLINVPETMISFPGLLANPVTAVP